MYIFSPKPTLRSVALSLLLFRSSHPYATTPLRFSHAVGVVCFGAPPLLRLTPHHRRKPPARSPPNVPIPHAVTLTALLACTYEYLASFSSHRNVPSFLSRLFAEATLFLGVFDPPQTNSDGRTRSHARPLVRRYRMWRNKNGRYIGAYPSHPL